ncbi:MAG: ABC transporter substrate-binding protein [Bacillota bacterium]|nr:MAG: ABC transporter substrate-binding protein [Bacillota bacterium]
MRTAKLKVFVAVLCVLGIVLAMSGCGPKRPEVVKIGVYAPITGPAAADGLAATNAAQLAADKINEAGGINGTRVEILTYDDRFESASAVAVAHQAIERDGVVALVSGSYSTPTRAVAPIAQEAGIPHVAGYAVHPDVTAAGNYNFRNSFVGTVQGKAGAWVAINQMNAQKVCILMVDTDFGRILGETFQAECEAAGVQVLSADTYPYGEKDFSALMTKIKGLNPDLLYATGYYAEGAAIALAAKTAGLTCKVLGMEGMDSPMFLELGGEATEGWVITSNLNRDDASPVTQEFIEEYETQFGIQADMVAASTYDAVLIVCEAMRLGGFEPAAIRDAIAGLQNFQGATGLIQGFTAGGEVIKPVQVQIVEGGEFHYYAVVDDPAIITPPN